MQLVQSWMQQYLHVASYMYNNAVMFVHIGSLAEMKQLESNLLSEVLNKNKDNNSVRSGSSKAPTKKKRPISSRRKVWVFVFVHAV